MKKIILIVAGLYLSFYIHGQSVAINTTGATADPSAILDVSHNDKGILIPRLETIRRTGMTNPAEGLLVYDINTRTFWYYSLGSWKELPNTIMGATPMGTASGDLSGNYPAPTVSKIQNLDVQFGVPFDRQVMKWDMLNNRWQGQNDSLFLPYNVTFGNASKLFAITNSNTTGGSSAIYGRSSVTGSSFIPGPTVAVWGDNSTGTGLFGSSNSGIGVNGISFSNYGIYGSSFSTNHAGVYASGGTGVTALYGEAGFGGIGVRGSSSFGKAAVFECNGASNTDTMMKLIHGGVGKGITLSLSNSTNPNEAFMINNNGLGQTFYLANTNTSNSSPFMYGNNVGTGVGLSMNLPNTTNSNPGIFVQHFGTGNGFESYAYKGKAGSFNIPSATNTSAALTASTIGTGNAATLFISNTSNSSTAVSCSTNGTGSVGSFTVNNSSNSNPALAISNNGTGRGLESVLTNNSNNNAAVYASSPGQYGVYSLAKTTAVYGQATGLTGGIAILGQSGLNNFDGIGVKGASYSDLQNRGAVTGDNAANGVGVYGISSGTDGIGVKGSSSSLTDGSAGVVGVNTGSGNGVYGYTSNVGGVAIAIKGFANASFVGNGIGVYGVTTTGYGVEGEVTNTGDGVKGQGGGTGNGVIGFGGSSNGDGVVGLGGGSSGNGIYGIAATTGNGVYGSAGIGINSGRAALFEIPSSGNTYDAVRVNNAGLGAALNLNATNSSNSVTMVRVKKSGTGDYMVFEDGSGINKIRFDNTGKGFFNGGTQTGGADIAEAFDIIGDRNDYEPGDVLVISTTKDRTVERSAEAYSSLVAGVYATKPGVLMTEENIDADLTGKVPMGVIGVIPVKVCLCNGEIKRGDILVTSSIPGVAMKGDIDKVKPGQIIGKALENYSSSTAGKIRALVNIK